MTQKQAIHVACRYVVVFLLISAIVDAIALPRVFLALRWDLQKAAIPREGMSHELEASVVHYLRDSVLGLASLVLRIMLNLAGALWFYNGSSRLQRFFGLGQEREVLEG